MLFRERGRQLVPWIARQPAENFLVHARNPRRRIAQPFAPGILAHGFEDVSYGALNSNPIDVSGSSRMLQD